ncbi:MAG: hypothetical protein ABIR58_10030 [Gemmatimonadaceae bacterium]
MPHSRTYLVLVVGFITTSITFRPLGAQAATSVEDVYVVRHPQGFWGVARSPKTTHGDQVGCRTVPR